MPIEPNEVDWHRHHEQWMLRQQQDSEKAKSKRAESTSDDFVPRVYVSAEMLEPPKQ